MLFNSFGFLAFFSVFVPIYYSASHPYRWVLLLAGSLYFYAGFNLNYLWLLLGVSSIAYAGALAVDAAGDGKRKSVFLVLGIVIAIAPLILFKYFDFLAESLEMLLAGLGLGSLALPRVGVAVAGLSFYTLSAVSYLVDVYRGQLAAVRHFGHLVVYTAFFPKLLAGPIERAKPFLDQLLTPARFSAAGVTAGLQLMLWGLFKKVVIADRLGSFVDSAYQLPALASPADLVVATYFFAFQLYCDFSGYSDIAIGAARVLGFDLMENFRRPYLSTSVSEFWAGRWHLSLSAWFRDYMYIPMGGNRVSRARRAVNVMAVFLVSGLWHGANWTFVVWGGLNGLYQLASGTPRDGRRSRVGHVFRVLLTFHLILVTWVFFRAETLSDALTIFSRTAAAIGRLPALLSVRLANPDILLSLALIAVLLLVETYDERRPFWESLSAGPRLMRWTVYYGLLIALIVLGTWNARQFVYMQF